MKSILIGICLCYSFSVMSQEASTRSVAESAQQSVKRWNEYVSLSVQQKETIFEISKLFYAKCDSINRLHVPIETRQKMKRNIHEESIRSIEGLLSSVQKTQLSSQQAARNLQQKQKQKQKNSTKSK